MDAPLTDEELAKWDGGLVPGAHSAATITVVRRLIVELRTTRAQNVALRQLLDAAKADADYWRDVTDHAPLTDHELAFIENGALKMYGSIHRLIADLRAARNLLPVGSNGESAQSIINDLANRYEEAMHRVDELEGQLAAAHELVEALSSREVEAAIVDRVNALCDAMRVGDAPAMVQNLIGALSTALALAIANGRWAALENRHAERRADRVDELEGQLAAAVDVINTREGGK